MLTTSNSSVQRKIALVVSVCWILYLTYLLTSQASAQLGEWAEPPHLTSSILLALTLSTVLSPLFSSNSLLGWWTLVTSTLFIIGFECLQLLVPGRAFQFMDIAQGVAGAAIAAMTCVLVSRIIGRNAYIWLAITVAVATFVTSLLLLTFDRPESAINCVQPATPVENTNLVLMHNFSQTNNTLVTSSFGSLCMFDSEPDERLIDLNAALDLNTTNQLVATKNNSLLLNGGGLISAELTGLRKALATNRELTFGVRFKANRLEAGRPSRLVVALQSADETPFTVALLRQNGPNAVASFRFQPWQGSGTVLTNRLQDRYHEIVLTYDGKVQTTYFDGSPVGTETTAIEAPDASGSELILNIGKRIDRRWNPFIGEISAIVVGAKSLSADEVATVFTQTKKTE